MTKGKGPKDKGVGAGGKHKKNKVAAEDKREHNFKHHDHGDKHFHDKAHAVKPIICVESKDDKIGEELLHMLEEEKRHHRQEHPRQHKPSRHAPPPHPSAVY